MLSITQQIKSLKLPTGSYIIVGGSILTALGIRELHDVDILVTPAVFAQFEQTGWQRVTWAGQPGLRNGIFEMGTQLHGYTIKTLQEQTFYVEGIPYITPELIYTIKQQLRRPRDVRDLQLLAPHTARFCPECLENAKRTTERMYGTAPSNSTAPLPAQTRAA